MNRYLNIDKYLREIFYMEIGINIGKIIVILGYIRRINFK